MTSELTPPEPTEASIDRAMEYAGVPPRYNAHVRNVVAQTLKIGWERGRDDTLMALAKEESAAGASRKREPHPETGYWPLVIKTTSDTKHLLWFGTEADRDAFVADTVYSEAAVMIAEGYESDAAVDEIADAAQLSRIESSACDQ